MKKITAIIHFCLLIIVGSACSQNTSKVSNKKPKEEKKPKRKYVKKVKQPLIIVKPDKINLVRFDFKN